MDLQMDLMSRWAAARDRRIDSKDTRKQKPRRKAEHAIYCDNE